LAALPGATAAAAAVLTPNSSQGQPAMLHDMSSNQIQRLPLQPVWIDSCREDAPYPAALQATAAQEANYRI
jgi:hypothetical protein